jgi:hypothetical protein
MLPVLLALLLVFLCGGCGNKEDVCGEIAAAHTGKSLEMTVSVRMTYLGKLTEYTMSQDFTKEASSFKIIEPKVLSGISAGIDSEGTLTFAGVVLVPENLPEGFSVFSLLHAAARSLSSGQSVESGAEGEEYRVTREVSIGEKTFLLDEWFDQTTLDPLRFEFTLDNARVLEATYTDFGMK